MPNKRSAGQQLITFPCDSALLKEVERARGRDTRSQFVRDALAGYLRSLGIQVEETKIAPPDRAGKHRAASLLAEPSSAYGRKAIAREKSKRKPKPKPKKGTQP